MKGPGVPVVVGTMIGTSVAAQIVQGRWRTENGIRIVIGGFLVGVALYALTGINANLGGAFGWFVLLAALLHNGVPALSKLTKGM